MRLLLHVQIMWMTTGIVPMMFPGTHQLMPPMGMGLNTACMPGAQAQGLNQMQRTTYYMNNSLPNQMPQIPSPAMNAPSVPDDMQNDNRIRGPRNPFLHCNDTLTATAQVDYYVKFHHYRSFRLQFLFILQYQFFSGARFVYLWISNCRTK